MIGKSKLKQSCIGEGMLPNCEYEDCCEVLELAEACSGLIFNNMVMLFQAAKRKKKGNVWFFF